MATITIPAMGALNMAKSAITTTSAATNQPSEVRPSSDSLAPLNDWPNDQGFRGDKDYRNPVELSLKGAIPAYAAGTLYRTGPGGYQVETDKGSTFAASHWFDGFSQVHRFQILSAPLDSTATRVMYNSRTTVDGAIDHIRKTGSLDRITFGQKKDPCQSYFKKVMSVFAPAPTRDIDSNIGVTLSINPPGLPSDSKDEGEGHASGISSLWAKTDSSYLKRIDPETLEPIGIAKQKSLHPLLAGDISAAHSKSCPKTGDVFNFNLEFGRRPTYRVFRVSASTGETDILATITTAPAAYIHSSFLTENFVILCIFGSHFSYGGLSILHHRNVLDSISPFDEEKPTLWYVVDRHHGRGVVATYKSDPFFAFHTVNAWEEASAAVTEEVNITADISAYENTDVLKRFYYENLMSTAPGARAYEGDKGNTSRTSLRRYRLDGVPLSKEPSHTTAQHIDPLWIAPKSLSAELPTMNPGYVTRPNRYIYGVTDTGKSSFLDGLVKFDTRHPHEASAQRFWRVHGHNPGEPIFVADPAAAEEEEDAGVLLSVVLDGTQGKSYLLCLDARTMKEVGRAEMDSVVGFGFHGAFAGSDRALDF
ncbi:MAG: hypothetical protein M1817_001100 [Caeruleum heppii]|nr:MAG: hypothetical protein M1817_001100 [Caeruleum heppii]